MKMVSKKLWIGILTLVMSVGMVSIQANATTIITDVHSCISAGYTYYIRKSGSEDALGTMYLTKNSNGVSNTFTAIRNCKETTAYVSDTNSGFKSYTVGSVNANNSFTVTKTVANPTIVYGKCSVTY